MTHRCWAAAGTDLVHQTAGDCGVTAVRGRLCRLRRGGGSGKGRRGEWGVGRGRCAVGAVGAIGRREELDAARGEERVDTGRKSGRVRTDLTVRALRASKFEIRHSGGRGGLHDERQTDRAR